MIIISENNQEFISLEEQFERCRLEEMSINDIQTADDNLPIRIVVQIPEHNPPHGLVLEKKKGRVVRGEFLIPRNPPKSASEIKDYRKGISDKDREIIFKWINKKSKRDLYRTNLGYMHLLWSQNILKYM